MPRGSNPPTPQAKGYVVFGTNTDPLARLQRRRATEKEARKARLESEIAYSLKKRCPMKPVREADKV